MLTIQRTCDHCNGVIPNDRGRIDLYDYPSPDRGYYPPMEVQERHFCTTHCLRGYVNNTYTNKGHASQNIYDSGGF